MEFRQITHEHEVFKQIQVARSVRSATGWLSTDDKYFILMADASHTDPKVALVQFWLYQPVAGDSNKSVSGAVCDFDGVSSFIVKDWMDISIKYGHLGTGEVTKRIEEYTAKLCNFTKSTYWDKFLLDLSTQQAWRHADLPGYHKYVESLKEGS